MNICILTKIMPSHAKGGVQDHVQMLASGLARGGHTVSIVTTARSDNNDQPTANQSDRLTIHYVPHTHPGKLDHAWWRESSRMVQALHAQTKFDILHSEGIAGYAVIRNDIHRSLEIPAVISFHGTHYDELVTRWRRGFSWNPWISLKNIAAIIIVAWKILMWDFRTIFHADGIVATSNEQSDLLKSFYHIPSDRIFSVWNGMDLSAFSPAEPSTDLLRKLDVRKDTPTILCMARLIRDKGIQHMIAAMPAILRAVPDCKLIIVGDGNYRSSLERLSTLKGLTSRIVFTGMADFGQLPDYFRLCSVFVNPTVQQNGYDLTMVEAMACEKVVISSDIGSTPTLIEDSVDGILFPTANVQILADRVIQLLQNPDRRKEIGKRARQKVMSNFTVDQMVTKTMAMYRTLMENS